MKNQPVVLSLIAISLIIPLILLNLLSYVKDNPIYLEANQQTAEYRK